MSQEHNHEPTSTAPCSGCGAIFCVDCIDAHVDACAQSAWERYQNPYDWSTTAR
jgi:hypothetical protein